MSDGKDCELVLQVRSSLPSLRRAACHYTIIQGVLEASNRLDSREKEGWGQGALQGDEAQTTGGRVEALSETAGRVGIFLGAVLSGSNATTVTVALRHLIKMRLACLLSR